jgi:hypothetical protein
MSQLVKKKRQVNFEDYKRFRFTRVLKSHSCHNESNLHTNSLNKLVFAAVTNFQHRNLHFEK